MAAALGVMIAPQSASGQASGPAGDSTAVVAPAPGSPRVAVEAYLIFARQGAFADAARYLGDDGTPELARKLKAVLDRHLWVDLALVSPLAAGDTTDGLAAGVDQLGTVLNGTGQVEPVYLRQQAGGTPAWVFDARSVARIEAWYGGLSDIWLRSRMPTALQQPGPLGIELWQWLMLSVLIPVAAAIAWVATRITIAIGRRGTRRTKSTLDDRLIERIRGPLLAIWTMLAYRALVDAVGLSLGAEQFVSLAVRVLTVVIATWLFIRAAVVLEEELPSSAWATAKPELRSLVPLLGRLIRILVIAVGLISIVAQFGYKVTTLLAGLGIGGLALALAAQKTLEHGFGSIAIGLDQPIRVGDWIKVESAVGTVEEIGLRSTRIRTLDRSVVVIPNGLLSEMQMENFGVRDRFLLRTSLGFEYATTGAQLRQVRDGLEAALKENPLVWGDTIVVRFVNFGAYSLDIEVIVWIETTDIDIFRAAREEIYFRFMQIVEDAGCSFAFPTQTINMRQ
jgi:MscS family membrane protein